MSEIGEDTKIQQINVREVFYNKSPKLAKLLPVFFYNWLEKVVHQKDINDFLKKHGNKTGVEFIQAAITDFNVTAELIGEENIPKDGTFIFACNHPLGGFDALLLLNTLSKYYRNVKFLVNDILMNIKNLTPLFIPINKHGGQSKEAIRQLDEAFHSDIQIVTFPAGLVSRKTNNRVVDPVWKKNFIVKSVKYKRDIIPVHITGRNTNFFYNLANFRKFLGLKYNIEMLFLADETFKHKNKHITITIGKAIPFSLFDKSKTYEEWAHEIKKIVYELGKDPL